MERACFVYDLIAIREGWLTFVNHNLSREETDHIISYLVMWSEECVLFV